MRLCAVPISHSQCFGMMETSFLCATMVRQWITLSLSSPLRGLSVVSCCVSVQRPEVSIVNNSLERCNCHVSCQLSCDARTCDDRHAASPTSSSTKKWKTPKNSMQRFPGSAFRWEQPLSRRAAYPGIGESVVIASWLSQNVKTRPQKKVMTYLLRVPVTTHTQAQRRRSAT